MCIVTDGASIAQRSHGNALRCCVGTPPAQLFRLRKTAVGVQAQDAAGVHRAGSFHCPTVQLRTGQQRPAQQCCVPTLLLGLGAVPPLWRESPQ